MVMGTDISDRMVELASKIATERQISNVHFETMDAEELQVDSNSYDVALCALGLMYVPDVAKALKQMHHCLKPGGRAVVAVWGKRSNCGWAEIFEIVDNRVSSDVCPMFFNLGNTDVLHKQLTAAGFQNIQIERLHTTLEYASGKDACIAAFAGGPVALPYHKFSPQIKDEVHAEYLASIRQFRHGNKYSVPGEFVVAVAHK